jgi:hypothetical protein
MRTKHKNRRVSSCNTNRVNNMKTKQTSEFERILRKSEATGSAEKIRVEANIERNAPWEPSLRRRTTNK